ncbi:hypothetical protein, partial [Klebsiella aerogenes]|uniref:hypothetical protein n=1 Tax=Klebsiella aerogenes TaxID=548 RepID=UPI001CBEDEA4
PLHPESLDGWRIVVDFRAINPLIKDEYQPLIDNQTVFTQIGESKAKYFSSFDILCAFYQNPLHESSRSVTAYSTRSRHV